MRKLLLISAILFFSTNGFTEDICLVEQYKEGMEFENCNVGDILVIRKFPKIVQRVGLIASKHCDYEKEIHDQYHFTCVLKTKTPRKIKEN